MANKKGGKGYKKYKKIDNENVDTFTRYKKDDLEEYGVVKKVLGACRFSILCYDGRTRIGQLRAGIKRSVRIFNDDWILVGLREYETDDEKCDILCKYSMQDIRKLKRDGVFEQINVDNKEEDVNEVDCFDFEDI